MDPMTTVEDFLNERQQYTDPGDGRTECDTCGKWVFECIHSCNGAQSEQVRAGDLWVLSWDGEVVGLAAIAAAKHGFVLAWPVTLPGEVSFAPGLVVENSPLGVPVTLWPTRETGIGDHLLDRSLGQLLLPDRIRPISFALDDSDDPGLAFAPGSARDSDNTEADRLMVDHWTELCFNAGGAEEGSFLDSAKVPRPRWHVSPPVQPDRRTDDSGC